MIRNRTYWLLLAISIAMPAWAAPACPKIDFLGFFSKDSATGSRLFVELKIANTAEGPISYVGTREKNRMFLSADREAMLQYLEPGARDWRSPVANIISRIEPKDAIEINRGFSASVFIPWDISYFIKSRKNTQYRYLLREKDGLKCPSRPFELQDGKAAFTYEYFSNR